jgi:hypothetical protein
MTKPLPRHPNVRNCTHIKVTGQQCGSPALRGEFFCYFHTRVIKGVQQRVDMRLDSMALLEDCEAIQLSIMHVVDGLVKGTLDSTRARLIIQALRIAARNAKNVRFDDCHYRPSEQPMVRQVPDYARQYLSEHPELGPPLSCGAGAPAREANKRISTPKDRTENPAAQQNAFPDTTNAKEELVNDQDSAAERQKNAANSASCGSKPKNDPAPKERKNHGNKPFGHENPPLTQEEKERERLQQAEAAIEGAERGNWRDLRTVFEFAGISPQSKEVPS